MMAVLVTIVAGLAGFAPAARAATTSVTYNATVTIPAPPSSSFAGAGAGGDGWAVALSSTQIFNVFHHQTTLMVMCHNQSDASACWGSYKTVTDTSGNGFSTSGQPGLYLDQTNHYLYVWATRTSDSTAGVVCIDTQSAAANPFCGFTTLSALNQAPYSGFSGISDPVMVGSHWYAFNDVVGPASGSENTLMCFDVSTDAACASQPYPVDFGGGSVTSASPNDSIAALGTKIVLQIPGGFLACFDTTTNSSCAGSWPVAVTGGTAGAPLPVLTSTGAYAGVCLPTSAPQCWDMTGATLAAPAGLSALTGNANWNGPATVIGARIYFPNGNTNAAECYDYSTGASCTNFPLAISNLSLLYTINPDPSRPTCLWVNANGGTSQIQNFDAYTGGTCANAPLRLTASSVVATNQVCVPASWTSLSVLSPSPSSYTSGTVAFDDADGNPISGVATHTLDATGTTILTNLNLSSTVPLPQFLVTLTGTTGSLGSVQIQVTWTGSYDPSCVQGGTSVTTATSPSTPSSPTASAGDGAATVSWTPPSSDGYSPITGYTATAYDSHGNVAGTCTAPGNATSCVISPLTDGHPYTFTVTATNVIGSASSLASPAAVPMSPSITTTSVTAGDIGAVYDRALAVTGGVGPYTWQLSTGTLPPGLGLGTDGHVTGTPTTAGSYPVTVQVTDVNGQTDTRQLTLVVNPATTVPAVPVNATPAGMPVTQQLVPQGGTGPFSWTLSSGTLPPGVTLNPDGTFTGTSTSPGTYTFTVEVTDVNGQTALQTVTVTVQPSDLNTRPIAATPDAKGYWVANPNGAVVPFGDAKSYGSMASTPLAAPIKGIAATNDGQGYWLVGADGGVFALGDAHFYGSAVGTHLGGSILGLTPTPDGKGYWLVGADGGVFAFGDAGFYGSAVGLAKHGTVESLAVTPDAHGYWLVGTDGGVFAFGDAHFYGSAANIHLAGPVTGIAATNDGQGYWLVGTDGGVFAFGDAHFYGSLSRIQLNGPATGIIASPDSQGYWLVANDGGVFAFGSSKFMGSIPGWTPPAA